MRTFGQVQGLTTQPLGLDVGAGINTNDATATANDIVTDKTAYVKGKKVTGTYNKTKSFASGGGTANSAGTFSVAGLNFVPAVIILRSTDADLQMKVYDNRFGSSQILNVSYLYSSGAGNYVGGLNGSWTISNGFSTAFAPNKNITWIAYD